MTEKTDLGAYTFFANFGFKVVHSEWLPPTPWDLENYGRLGFWDRFWNCFDRWFG